MLVNSLFSMITTRYLSDCLYEDKKEKIIPAFIGSSLIMMALGTVIYGVFLHFSGISFTMQMLCICLLNELIITMNSMNILSAIKDYKSILYTFAFSAVIAVCSGIIGLFVFKFDIMSMILVILIIAYGIMTVSYFNIIVQCFPKGKGSILEFLIWFDKYPQLAIVSVCLSFGLVIHQIVVWHGDLGRQLEGLFYSSSAYDISVLLAYASVIITQISFVTSMEVKFNRSYKEYFKQLNCGGKFSELKKAENEMKNTLINELSYIITKQFFVTLLFVILVSGFLHTMSIGLNTSNLSIFRTLCLAFAFYIIGNCGILLLLYFADNKGAMICSVAFAVVTLVASVALSVNDRKFSGYSFLIGSLVFLLCTLGRLFSYLDNIEYRLLSSQPIVHVEKKGFMQGIVDKYKEVI